MKIVNAKDFLMMPANTVYSKYTPCFFNEICIKGDTVNSNDFFYQPISDSVSCSSSDDFIDILSNAEDNNGTFTMDFDCEMRDGCFNQNQLYAIWDKEDIKRLISRLSLCVLD